MTSRDTSFFFEKAPAALLAVDAGTLRVVAANEKALLFLGYSSQQIPPVSLQDLLPPAELERVAEVLLGNSASGEIQNSKILDSSGAMRESDLAINRLSSDNVILFSIQDASARGRIEEQLRQSQKMEALGMLAGGIAHDFNNLLTIISGYSQMLQGGRMTSDRDRTALEQVLKACERAADLTAQLLAFSRRQTIQPRVLDVNRLVDQTAALLRRLIGEDIDLRIRKTSEAGCIHADAGQIQQMLLNLAINARDAMPQGGALLIQTRDVELRTDYIGQHLGVKPGKYVLLEVADTGVGMDEATRRRVFEPLFTTKAAGKGTGLGLSTVYGIVKQFGGSIDLYTEPGHGATFRVYLPRVEDKAGEERAEQPEVRGGHETLLLVEDEEGVRKMVRAALERCGYRVLVAASGPEALEVAQSHHGSIDVLITDMVMPRMNGRELAVKLSEDRPETSILYMSGYPGDTLQSTGALTGEAEFLQKPFAPIVLTAKVREILDRMKNGAEKAGRP
jgi:PAS domain S-box-containing protein